MAGRGRVPAAGVAVFPDRALLQEEVAAAVEEQHMHGPVPQVVHMHEIARFRPQHPVAFIHHVEHLGPALGRRGAGDSCQRFPLGQRQLLGPDGFRNLQRGGDIRPFRFELGHEIAELFSPLRKSSAHERVEERFVQRAHFTCGPPVERDHGRVHSRRREKNRGRKLAQIRGPPPAVHADRHRAVIFRAR